MIIKKIIVVCAALAMAFTMLAGCTQQRYIDMNTPIDGGTSSPIDEIDASEAQRLAGEWLQNCLDGNFDTAYEACDQVMKGIWDQDGGLEAVWLQMVGQLGAYKTYTNAGQSLATGYFVSLFDMEFENGAIRATVSVDTAGQIIGVYLVPKPNEPDRTPLPSSLAQQPISIDAGKGYPLDGYITYPAEYDGKLPCAILIQGTGAAGMDQVIGQNRTFEQLAYGLAQRGMAVIRFDKRNNRYPEISLENDFSVVDEYIEDFAAAVNLAKQRPECDPNRIFLIGHSQGGMLAPRIADEAAGVAGMVLLAGTPYNLVELLQAQQDLLAKDMDAAGNQIALAQLRQNQQIWLAEYEALQGMTEEEAKQAGSVYSFPAWYIYEMIKFTPSLELIKKNDLPILIMQGSNDVQVYADKDFTAYKQGLANFEKAEFKLYNGLNHLFMPSQAKGMEEGLNEYNVPNKIDTRVMDDISEWISRH